MDISNLGELEMLVMDFAWSNGETHVKNAHAELGVSRGITHNTVQSTFKRLHEKGHLARRKESHAYLYSARITRTQLTEFMVRDLVDQVAGVGIREALQAFVNLAEHDGSDSLEALERLVAERRRAQNASKGT